MRVVLATNNLGKLAEFRALPCMENWQIIPQTDFDFAEAVEDGETFVENALLKARHACTHTGLAAIADDSGLEVDALAGAPGIYSARYAGENASSADNINKLLKNLNSVATPQRAARFRCVLVFMRNPTDPCPVISVGSWEGRIAEVPNGENGFGYDAIFYPDGMHKTAAQLDAAVKNRLSHRAQALNQLTIMLTSKPPITPCTSKN